jgi:hypothetical protein
MKTKILITVFLACSFGFAQTREWTQFRVSNLEEKNEYLVNAQLIPGYIANPSNAKTFNLIPVDSKRNLISNGKWLDVRIRVVKNLTFSYSAKPVFSIENSKSIAKIFKSEFEYSYKALFRNKGMGLDIYCDGSTDSLEASKIVVDYCSKLTINSKFS